MKEWLIIEPDKDSKITKEGVYVLKTDDLQKYFSKYTEEQLPVVSISLDLIKQALKKKPTIDEGK